MYPVKMILTGVFRPSSFSTQSTFHAPPFQKTLACFRDMVILFSGGTSESGSRPR